MRTRSAGKQEAFLMLAEDRKTALPQDFDEQGHKIDIDMGSLGEREADAILAKLLCGWACNKCFVTRFNFLIAGLCFTLALYVISETTLFFEQAAHFLTGLELPTAQMADKSFEKFLETHYVQICLLGPALVFGVALSFYCQIYSGYLKGLCKCSRICSLCSTRRCCGSAPSINTEAQQEPEETADERSSKIQNRKKTPASKRKASESPKKQRARKGESKSPEKRRSDSPAKKSKKSLDQKTE